MKKNVVPLFGILLYFCFFNSCNEQKRFTIKGSFKVTDPTPVQLYYLTEESTQRIDSVYAATGSFILRGNIDYPGIYLMKFFNDQSIYLVIHPGDNINIDIDNISSEISYYVENSPDSKRIKELIDKQNLILKQIDALSQEWQQHRGDTIMRHRIDSVYSTLMLEHKLYTKSFIYDSPRSLANILALYQNFGRKSQSLFDKYDDFNVYSFVDSNLVLLYPESDAVKVLNREVNNIEQQMDQNKYIEKIIEEGRPFPILNYADIHGDTVTIETNYNKPVVLYFWATWNPYSVEELLALNNFCEKTQSDNITCITVSLDTSEKELRKFLSTNNITLPVICDYAYWDSEIIGRYAVKRIPSNIIRNKYGSIVGIDIFSDELMNRLNELSQ